MVMRIASFLLIVTLVATLSACDQKPVEPTTETELRLGTTITVSIYQDPPEDAFERVFERVLEIEEKMSSSTEDYETTEVLRINRAPAGLPVTVSADTFAVIERGLEFSRVSDGAFDITIAPLVQLWAIGTDAAGIPSKDSIEEVLPLVGYRMVELDRNTLGVVLEKQGMGVDVGGIAKGYAADESIRILRDLGVRHALLDFGGNIVTLGMKPDGSRWRIGIQNPNQERGSYVGIVETDEEAVVTSGPYERYFVEDGVRYHHIIDPDDGYPVRNGLGSVTIVSPDSTAADALSTACYVLGLDAGFKLVESLPQVEAIFITDANAVHLSDGLADRFDLTNSAFHLAGSTDTVPSPSDQ
jgi:thiamine biosynthesis lipoprotein